MCVICNTIYRHLGAERACMWFCLPSLVYNVIVLITDVSNWNISSSVVLNEPACNNGCNRIIFWKSQLLHFGVTVMSAVTKFIQHITDGK